ncbi:hypothetical protein PPMP20_02710 [Paraburkholderia phymatum]|uniref:hypothetical protein n=1 Tax=Paraburkholderia phymatum TaxID=148447 RepID=UPI0012FD689C|nr:hypothetical protein [Paraburkholderia phymatum]
MQAQNLDELARAHMRVEDESAALNHSACHNATPAKMFHLLRMQAFSHDRVPPTSHFTFATAAITDLSIFRTTPVRL